MSTVAILGEVCIQRDAVLRNAAQLRRKPIEILPDLLKFIEHLAMLLPQLFAPTLMMAVDLPQRFQLDWRKEKYQKVRVSFSPLLVFPGKMLYSQSHDDNARRRTRKKKGRGMAPIIHYSKKNFLNEKNPYMLRRSVYVEVKRFRAGFQMTSELGDFFGRVGNVHMAAIRAKEVAQPTSAVVMAVGVAAAAREGVGVGVGRTTLWHKRGHGSVE